MKTCRYTGALVDQDQALTVGTTLPNVKARYIIANTDQAKTMHKQQIIAFHEHEANCNTCKNLCRVKHEKDQSGFLHGICQINQNPIEFHPDDPMHMSCYVSRWA